MDLGYSIHDGETILEYSKRIKKENIIDIISLTKMYQQSIFREKKKLIISEQEINKIRVTILLDFMQQASALLRAFRLNLTALSLISLFVGGFLVYSSTQASLVRRRGEFGLLRTLGATRVR